jgi:putative PIN family toxin of toxin-antitoxin system
VILLDTNIFVSYSLSRSSALGQRVAETLSRHPYAFSDKTFGALTEVVMRDKFDRYIGHPARIEMLRYIATRAEWFNPSETIHDCRDPKDNKFLELAAACHADFLITGDEDLLTLNPFRKTRIITLSEFASLHLKDV